ncbi:hypothetical protein [Flavobacterium restrictum]|uniref:Uncharacterized protein n=1 Tax=Flavobacterium restrictum TaxID=2594428 RepID=A0A553DRI1_9FLAO|nr:hypothetical protein [Flavobacterium restrictum]TRX35391.1 hypothetical protein FNW21_15135 [Flavobacterium restrictum]
MEEKEFVFKRSFKDGKQRRLLFNPKNLQFEDKDFGNDLFTLFEKEAITDYRFGIRWIRFELTYGREYQIFVRSKENKVIKISFRSYLGRKKNILHKFYTEILTELWNYYFEDIIHNFINKHNRDEEFSIGDVLFTKDCLELNISGIFNQKKVVIPWDKIRTRGYRSYFSIYSIDNPSEINRGYSYKEDWNTNVLHSVIRTLLKQKKIETYE